MEWIWALPILEAAFAAALLVKWVAEKVDQQNGLARATAAAV